MGKNEVLEVDNILAMVGYRPDTSITEELQVTYYNATATYMGYQPLQVHYCYATEGPMKLAAALMAAGGGGGDCLAQVNRMTVNFQADSFLRQLPQAATNKIQAVINNSRCLQVVPGPATLLTPEPGLLVLGMKSYGRGSAFLLRLLHQ